MDGARVVRCQVNVPVNSLKLSHEQDAPGLTECLCDR